MKRHRGFWLIVLGCYICFIYMNSLMPASVSSKQSGGVLEAIEGYVPFVTEVLIRKSAHFIEYMGLAFLMGRCFFVYGIKGKNLWFVTLIVGFLVPFVDESIQLFVEGRSGQISDVWLDLAGVAFGTLIFYGVWFLMKGRGKNETKL